MDKVPNSLALVNVYYRESGYGERLETPPLGLGYLSEYLIEKSVEHHIIDMGLGYTKDQVIEKIKDLNVSSIGFSINSICMEKTVDLMTSVKNAVPSSKIIAGGPHVSTIREAIFDESPCIDYAIIGEGEESLYRLLTGDSLEKIAGLLYVDSRGKFQINQKMITENIDTIPFPTFTKFELSLYADKSIPLLTSRGCPFKCIFCQQSSLLSKNWRGNSAEYFVKEIMYWIKRGYREFQILDDNFTYDGERLNEIKTLFSKNKISGIRISIVGGIRVSAMTKEKLFLLRDLGIDYISFGIESFSDKVLQFMKKGINTNQIEEIVRIATDIGFKVRLFFIIGFPYETKESLDAMFEFAMKYPIYQARFFNLTPYPQTELMHWINENGKLIYSPKEYMNHFKEYQQIPLFEAKFTMSVEERVLALKRARKISDIISRRSMNKRD